MAIQSIEKLFVKITFTLKQALLVLNESTIGFVLLVDDDKKLLRTVTDGDIRRLILAGFSLEDTLENLPNKKPIVALENQISSDALAILDEYGVDQLPVVDENGVPVRILLRRDFAKSILLSTPHMGLKELEYILEAFNTNWIAPLGPNVNAFENELASIVGVKAAAAVSSGTAAIHLALRLCDVGPGDIVFCSDFTFIASANPILYQQATPVFIDAEPDTWNMSPQALQQAFDAADKNGQLPKAVVVANIYGQSADMFALQKICDQYEVPIIEDAAESLGATYYAKASGTLGKLGIYSFNGNKIITTSGGGMLVSDDEELIAKARFLATQARDPKPYYHHTEVGYNYRLSNVLAGIGRGQLQVLSERVQARREAFAYYQSALQEFEGLSWMPEPENYFSTRWLSACQLSKSDNMPTPAELIRGLAEFNIEARHVWKPMHQQPLFKACQFYQHTSGTPISERLFNHALCLPSGSNLTESELNKVTSAIKNLLKKSVTNKEVTT